MKTLFIGGTLSGKKLNVADTYTYRNVIKLPNLSPGYGSSDPPIEEVYHKYKFKGDPPFDLFLHCSIKPEHIARLLKLSHGQEEA